MAGLLTRPLLLVVARQLLLERVARDERELFAGRHGIVERVF